MSNIPRTPERTPFIPVGRSALRHPLLVVLPVLVGLAIAGYLGLSRAPVYKGTVQMSIGRIDLGAPGALAGFSVATQNLASAYSRAISADAVVQPVAAKLHTTTKSVKRRLSASPIADSPVFIVEAKAGSPRLAVETANLASTSLTDYVTELNRSNPDSQRLFRAFQGAALAYNRLVDARESASRAYDLNPTKSRRRRLDRARAKADGALLRRETLRVAYQNSNQGQSSTSLVQTLSPAQEASSDRGPKLQIFLFSGLLGGVAVGLATATWWANRRRPLADLLD
jgi:capsular polysaccharide biosynthesis protein